MEVMRAALECAHRGWGESCVIGVAGAGKAGRVRGVGWHHGRLEVTRPETKIEMFFFPQLLVM